VTAVPSQQLHLMNSDLRYIESVEIPRTS